MLGISTFSLNTGPSKLANIQQNLEVFFFIHIKNHGIVTQIVFIVILDAER